MYLCGIVFLLKLFFIKKTKKILIEYEG